MLIPTGNVYFLNWKLPYYFSRVLFPAELHDLMENISFTCGYYGLFWFVLSSKIYYLIIYRLFRQQRYLNSTRRVYTSGSHMPWSSKKHFHQSLGSEAQSRMTPSQYLFLWESLHGAVSRSTHSHMLVHRLYLYAFEWREYGFDDTDFTLQEPLVSNHWLIYFVALWSQIILFQWDLQRLLQLRLKLFM